MNLKERVDWIQKERVDVLSMVRDGVLPLPCAVGWL